MLCSNLCSVNGHCYDTSSSLGHLSSTACSIRYLSITVSSIAVKNYLIYVLFTDSIFLIPILLMKIKLIILNIPQLFWLSSSHFSPSAITLPTLRYMGHICVGNTLNNMAEISTAKLNCHIFQSMFHIWLICQSLSKLNTHTAVLCVVIIIYLLYVSSSYQTVRL